MKQTFLVIVFFSISVFGYSQRNVDIGGFGGTSYYLGNLNQNTPFTSPRYSAGPLIRYNFGDRYSLRGHVIYANIAGADTEANQNITKRNYPVNFSANLVNAAIQTEFNFFPYETYQNPGGWTPYIFGGIGYSILLGSNVEGSLISPSNHLTLPFGVGMKYNFTRRMSAGFEWSQQKTFTSEIDGVISPVGDTFLFQNDWYSFFGLFITYKFFKFAADCPAYD